MVLNTELLRDIIEEFDFYRGETITRADWHGLPSRLQLAPRTLDRPCLRRRAPNCVIQAENA